MANKNVKTRVSNKYDMASNWEKATFIPMQGEFIIYSKEDIDENGEIYERFDQEQIKIGDGIHTVNELPFIDTRKLYMDNESAPENALTGTFKVVPSTDAVIDANNGTCGGGGQKLYRHDIRMECLWGSFISVILFTIINTDPTNYTKSGVILNEDESDIDWDNSFTLTADDVLFIPTHDIPAIGTFGGSDGADSVICSIVRSGDVIKFGKLIHSSGGFYDYIETTNLTDDEMPFHIYDIECIYDTVTEVM